MSRNVHFCTLFFYISCALLIIWGGFMDKNTIATGVRIPLKLYKTAKDRNPDKNFSEIVINALYDKYYRFLPEFQHTKEEQEYMERIFGKDVIFFTERTQE